RHCDPTRIDLRMALRRRSGAYLAEIEPARLAAAGSIRAMLRREKPDLVMSFGMGVALATAVAMKTLGRHRPVWVCREDSNTWAEIDNLTPSRGARWAIGRAVCAAYRSADAVLCVSRDLGARLIGQIGLPGAKVRAIHNPIEIGAIASAAAEPLALAQRRPFVVAAGRLTLQKGHALMIEAFARAPAATECDLVILGEGPLEVSLRARAAALGVGDRVIFAGFQANPWAWFARARLFVLPSLWEGFGNVIAEAMACGAPVLATDCDFGPREQIGHGENGWLVAPNDAGALAAGLQRLLTDPVLTEHLAAAGRVRAADFDAAAIGRVYTDYLVAEAKLRPPLDSVRHAR
ncbi:MAG: glycosyltransferase, partial [Caulobacteraceae bacterium]